MNQAVAAFPRSLAVLGATGSVGRQALDVVRRSEGRFRVVGLAAGRDWAGLRDLVREFRPRAVALRAPWPDGGEAEDLRRMGCSPLCGPAAATDLVRAVRADVVLDAVPGFAGLGPALASLERHCLLAMASKEAVAGAGHLLLAAARPSGARVVPVDSETTGLLRCLEALPPSEAPRRVWLTASGGPFWGRRWEDLAGVGPEEALRHPSWRMGPKITVDSATLFNKGLEALEICRLFGLPLDAVRPVVQRSSLVHVALELEDGSILAQLGAADMRLPIALALHYPLRPAGGPGPLELDRQALGFEELVPGLWPCLEIALRSGRTGGTMPAAVSAADEVLVQSFLFGRLGFTEIGEGLRAAFEAHEAGALASGTEPALAAVAEADRWAREFAAHWAAKRGSRPRARVEEDRS